MMLRKAGLMLMNFSLNMKRYCLILALAAMGCAQAETVTQWVDGVGLTYGWTDYNKNNVEDGDDYLCWAAAASNVINWWQNRYEIPAAAPRGEDIWTTFKNSTNPILPIEKRGGNASCGFQWWLTGIYDINSTEPEGGEDVDYRYAYMGVTPGEPVAIVNERKNQQTGFTGYYRELEVNLPSYETHRPYAWNNELSRFFTREAGYAVTRSTAAEPVLTTLEQVSLSVVDCISRGAGVTLSLQTDDSAHAVTLWGAKYNNETGMLEGVWLTDSDDNLAGGVYAEQGLFYATIGKSETGTYTLSQTVDGVTTEWQEDRTYLTLNPVSGWLQGAQIQEFHFYNTAVSDLWGLETVPEPATATLGLLALAGLAARRRRR